MSKNIVTNKDDTHSLYTQKKGVMTLIRYELQHLYRPLYISNILFFRSKKKAKSCYDYLTSLDVFKRMGGCTFRLYKNIINVQFTSVKLCTFVDELEKNPNYVEDRKRYYASLDKINQ